MQVYIICFILLWYIATNIWEIIFHYIKGEAERFNTQALMHFLFLKRKNIPPSSFTFMLSMFHHVICHQGKEAIHSKTTYKLSTATSVTSFIDTFFCSIIWRISPVGKHMTLYFQHKAQHTLCLCFRAQHPNTCMCFMSHSPALPTVTSLH